MAFQIWTSKLWWDEASSHKEYGVQGFPLINKPERVCEGCIFGKQHREIFLVEKSYRARTPLEIMPFDICGRNYFET